MAATLIASCYSTNYRREAAANIALISDLANKLGDYCAHNFQLEGRPVSSEEMGEFYYALKKARSWSATTADSGRPSYREFEALLDAYAAYLKEADEYRLRAKPDPETVHYLLVERDAVRRLAKQVLDTINAGN